jgi:hypothetical protein
MSVRVLERVWAAFPGSGSDLIAMLALADWSDDAGRCWPSVATIATKMRLQPRQAQRVLNGLIQRGFLEVTGNPNGGAPGSTRRYRVVLESLTGVVHDAPTGVLHDTGVTDDTGVLQDVDGCHPRHETGVLDDTQTVIEPSITVIHAQKRKSTPALSAAFDAFWRAYPKRVGKAKAKESFTRLKPDETMLAIMLAAVERQKSSRDWTKDGGQFIPHPSTWLNARRWEDEHQPAQSVSQDWVQRAGFSNPFEAHNAGCYQHNAQMFQNGHRLEVTE